MQVLWGEFVWGDAGRGETFSCGAFKAA
jgi:hypothetical protein